jgi:subtilase family serine protease
VAYGVAPLISSGITGSGETVVFPEVANAPGPDFTDIRQDLAAFDSTWNLPPASLKVTSASTPLWAAVIALADQEAGQHLGFVNPAIYSIARGPAYHSAFHHVVTGDNSVFGPTSNFTGYQAGPGWDPVTGWGSPNAQVLVPLLAHTASHGASAHD